MLPIIKKNQLFKKRRQMVIVGKGNLPLQFFANRSIPVNFHIEKKLPKMKLN